VATAPVRVAALAIALVPGPWACRPSAPPPSAVAVAAPAGPGPAAGQPQLDGRSIHYSRLTPFAPDPLGGYRGGAIRASTSQFGEVSVSEVERVYQGQDRSAKVRLVDTSLNDGARSPPLGEPYEDEEKVGRPMRASDAVGFVEFEKESRRATANLIVADRLLVTVTCEGSTGTGEAERLAAALDLRGLSLLVRSRPRVPAVAP